MSDKRQFEAGKTYTYQTYYSECVMDYATEECECVKRTKCFVWMKDTRSGEVSKRKIQQFNRDYETCDAPGYGGEFYTVCA